MKVKGFWHIYMVNHWYSIVMDQLRILISSGLYQRCESINISCIGPVEEYQMLHKYIVSVNPKINILTWSIKPEDYEFPALKLIEDDNSDYVCFYFHTKGATRPFETRVNHWRGWLNEFVLNQWQEHLQRILEGYDVSAVNFLKDPDHYSGNFWWARRSYLNSLPKIADLDHSYRFHAEQWICMGQGKYFKEKFIEPGNNAYTLKCYV